MVTADDAGAHGGSVEVAGVNRLYFGEAQPFGELFELQETYFREMDIGMAVNRDFFIPLHLSVSDQIQPGAFFHGEAS